MQPRRRSQPRLRLAPRGRPPPRPAARRACTGARRWRPRQSGRGRCASWSPSWLPTRRCSTFTPPSGARPVPLRGAHPAGLAAAAPETRCSHRQQNTRVQGRRDTAGRLKRASCGPRAYALCCTLSKRCRSRWSVQHEGLPACACPVAGGLHLVPAACRHVRWAGFGRRRRRSTRKRTHRRAARRYFPCTVDWFLARCEVVEVRRGWRRRVLRVLERAGALTGAGLQARLHTMNSGTQGGTPVLECRCLHRQQLERSPMRTRPAIWATRQPPCTRSA